MPARARADKLLVDRGCVPSRERARQLIMAGEVWSGETRIDKPGTMLAADAPIEIRGGELPFVSRGGLKLDAALTYWKLSADGLLALDVGASTGGFTDCLLQRGARHVFAIDVGYGQFAWSLRQDPRVTLMERLNIRHVTPDRLPAVDIAVIDVSFIALRLVLPAVAPLVRSGGHIVALVKPQFEVGREHVGKGGVVRDPALHAAAVAAVIDLAPALGLAEHGSCPSPLLGPKGNREFFVYFTT